MTQKYALVENGIVLNVILVEDSVVPSLDGSYVKVTEETGGVQPGFDYDEDNGKFISPKPYDSWELNDDFKWESPAGPMPSDGIPYSWNEEEKTWDPFIAEPTEE